MHFSDIFNLRYTNRALNIEFATKIYDDQCYWSYYLFPVKNLSKLEFFLVLRTYCVFCPRPCPRDILPWPGPYLAFHFSPLVTSVVAASAAVQNLLIH